MVIRYAWVAVCVLILSGCADDVSCPDGMLVSVHALHGSPAAWDTTGVVVESGSDGFCSIVPTEPL